MSFITRKKGEFDLKIDPGGTSQETGYSDDDEPPINVGVYDVEENSDVDTDVVEEAEDVLCTGLPFFPSFHCAIFHVGYWPNPLGSLDGTDVDVDAYIVSPVHYFKQYHLYLRWPMRETEQPDTISS